MPEPRIILKPQFHYHLYNHAVGKENLFSDDSDFRYFLSKLKDYILPVCDVFCYCLMPNHFHLIVRVKDETEIKKIINQKFSGRVNPDEKLKADNYYLNDQLSRIFSNFFNTYAKHYNFKMSRQGTLFKRAFRRKEITEIKYLQNLICYVHQNPVKIGFASNLAGWKYSSFNAIISQQPTLILREEVIELFNDLENFRFCHAHNVEM